MKTTKQLFFNYKLFLPKKEWLIAIVVVLSSFYNLSAQQGEVITGIITSVNDGSPLPGANVLVKGTSKGVITDFEGQYSINASPNDVLIFSFLGFQSQEITVGNQTNINIALEDDTTSLDEVVVTALGIKKEKRALGYSVGTVDNEILMESKESNVVAALAGKIAGVQINTPSGQAGSTSRIVIRGTSSMSYNNEPLFVVDGVPIDNSNLQAKDVYNGSGVNSGIDLDPNSIENISVLKGAAASALYGSRAANGVVLITTKSGKMNTKAKVTISHTSSFEDIVPTPIQDTWAHGYFDQDLGKYVSAPEGFKTDKSWGARIDDTPGAERYDRWQTFKTGYTSDTNISIQGGTDKVSYYVGLSNLDQGGTLPTVYFKRSGIKTNFKVKLSDKITATFGMDYKHSSSNRLWESWNPRSMFSSFLGAPANWNPNPVYEEDGVTQRLFRGAGRNNYLWYLQDDNVGDHSERDRFLPNFGINVDLSKVAEGLSLNAVVGVDMYKHFEEDYFNLGAYGGDQDGQYTQINKDFSSYNSDIMLNYNKKLGDFNIDLMAGHNLSGFTSRQTMIDGSNLMIPGFYDIANARSQIPSVYTARKKSYSVYGSAMIGWKNMLYYTFTGRNDWSSTLPKENNSFFYPSNSLAFVFSELLGDDSFIDFGKLRVSYAQVGNDAPIYSVSSANQIAVASSNEGIGSLSFPYQGVGSFLPSPSANNPILKNEMSYEFEVGLEMTFFKHRLGFETSYYDKVSKDQIVRAGISPTSGFSSALMNIGQISNKGVELLVFGTPVKTTNFSWDISANWYSNKNTLDKISDNLSYIDLVQGVAYVEGHSVPSIRGTAWLRDENGKQVVDDDPASPNYGRWMLDQSGKKVIGKVNPDWQMGINNSFKYKDFTLSAFLDMRFGGHIVSGSENYLLGYGMSTLTEDRPDNNLTVFDGVKGRRNSDGSYAITSQPNDIETLYDRAYINSYAWQATEMVTMKSDFIKLRTVTLGYSVPKGFLKNDLGGVFSNLDIALSGKNLWRWFDPGFTGPDPEVNQFGNNNVQGWYTWAYPTSKSYHITLKASF